MRPTNGQIIPGGTDLLGLRMKLDASGGKRVTTSTTERVEVVVTARGSRREMTSATQ